MAESVAAQLMPSTHQREQILLVKLLPQTIGRIHQRHRHVISGSRSKAFEDLSAHGQRAAGKIVEREGYNRTDLAQCNRPPVDRGENLPAYVSGTKAQSHERAV